MKNYTFIFLFLVVFFSGCKDQEVKLPLIGIPGISEIQNHSSIWVFKEIENNTPVARLNKNNKILNTHWIFNIDKDLPMAEVIPVLIKMQENRNKDSMHKKEGMINYFSYADTANKQISLIPFSDKKYILEEEGMGDEKMGDKAPCDIMVEIIGNALHVNDQSIALEELSSFLKKQDSCQGEEAINISLKYHDQTTYQDYLHTKVYLYNNALVCNNVEYMYTVK